MTQNKIEIDNRTLYQVQLLRSMPKHYLAMGELGGYIENDKNLAFERDCGLHASKEANSLLSMKVQK